MNFSKENVKVAFCRMPVLSKQSHYRKKMTRSLRCKDLNENAKLF
jgi:hypothetical protein